MSLIHEVECDLCHKKEVAYYNGEHYLAPEGWVVLTHPKTGEEHDLHLCKDCTPKKVKSK